MHKAHTCSQQLASVLVAALLLLTQVASADDATVLTSGLPGSLVSANVLVPGCKPSQNNAVWYIGQGLGLGVDRNTNCCLYPGVTCTVAGDVAEINWANWLVGGVRTLDNISTAELAPLTQLTALSLPQGLSGTLPADWLAGLAPLTNLQRLNMWGDLFTGTIPAEWSGALPNTVIGLDGSTSRLDVGACVPPGLRVAECRGGACAFGEGSQRLSVCGQPAAGANSAAGGPGGPQPGSTNLTLAAGLPANLTDGDLTSNKSAAGDQLAEAAVQPANAGSRGSDQQAATSQLASGDAGTAAQPVVGAITASSQPGASASGGVNAGMIAGVVVAAVVLAAAVMGVLMRRKIADAVKRHRGAAYVPDLPRSTPPPSPGNVYAGAGKGGRPLNKLAAAMKKTNPNPFARDDMSSYDVDIAADEDKTITINRLFEGQAGAAGAASGVSGSAGPLAAGLAAPGAAGPVSAATAPSKGAAPQSVLVPQPIGPAAVRGRSGSDSAPSQKRAGAGPRVMFADAVMSGQASPRQPAAAGEETLVSPFALQAREAGDLQFTMPFDQGDIEAAKQHAQQPAPAAAAAGARAGAAAAAAGGRPTNLKSLGWGLRAQFQPSRNSRG